MPNGIHSNVGLGGSNLFLSSMNKSQHSNINGKRNGNAIKNGVNRQSDNEYGGGQYFSSSDEAHSGYALNCLVISYTGLYHIFTCVLSIYSK